MRRKVLSLVLIAAIFVTLILPREISVYAASNADANIFDISEGNIIISQGTTEGLIKVKFGIASEEDDITTGQQITIIGTSGTNGVIVSGVTANVTLKNVNISNTNNDKCAFELTGGANVTLALEAGTNEKRT